MKFLDHYKTRVKDLVKEIKVLAVAYQDSRVPWHAKVLMGIVIGYAVSPIDLIPDFIPVIGLVDDLLLVPLGIYLCLKLIPAEIMVEARIKAEHVNLKKSYMAALVIVVVWLLFILGLIQIMLKVFKR